MRNVDFNDNMSEQQYKKRLDYALPNLFRKTETTPQGCSFFYIILSLLKKEYIYTLI